MTPPRAKWFWASLIFTLTLTTVITAVGRPMTTEASPLNIISFEFVWTIEQAKHILSHWDAPTRQAAAFVMGVDYLYMVAYATTLSLGCLHAHQWTTQPHLQTIGLKLVWGAWLAALADAIENVAQVALLFGHMQPIWPKVTFIGASIKFALVFLCIGYILCLLPLRFKART